MSFMDNPMIGRSDFNKPFTLGLSGTISGIQLLIVLCFRYIRLYRNVGESTVKNRSQEKIKMFS